MEQWVRDVQGRQRDAQGWLLKLCRIWLRTISLLDPFVIVGDLQVEWPDLIGADEEIKRKKIELGLREGLLTRATALRLLELVDNALEESQAAEDEADARREAMFPEGDTLDFRNRLEQDEAGDNGADV
jgi:hypothetical protein